jgi:hypothetical protein
MGTDALAYELLFAAGMLDSPSPSRRRTPHHPLDAPGRTTYGSRAYQPPPRLLPLLPPSRFHRRAR